MATLNTTMAREFGARLIQFADTLEDCSARERLLALMDRTSAGTFHLVVVGEIKKGKSSFINALLGHPELLPALTDVATSTVFQVSWGEQLSYRVHFQAQDPVSAADMTIPPPLAIEAAEVSIYGTEDGNPNNQRGVDYIAVALPHPLLRQGLTLIDTPGLGGLFQCHADILWRYAPAADAVFFVLDSVEAVASRPEMDALERLRRMTPLLFFVQTKTDLAPQEQWQAWRTRNLEILAKTLQIPQETLRYFPLSAKLKQAADRRQDAELLRDSGYEALLHFLQDDLMAFKDAYLASHLVTALAAEASLLNQRGTQQWRALTAKTQEDLKALDQDALTARNAFRLWKESTYREIKAEFGFKAKELKREHESDLQNRLDPGATGPIVSSLMIELRTAPATTDLLAQALDDLRSEMIDRCARELFDIHDTYQQRMRTLIATTTERMGASLPISLEIRTEGLRIDRDLPPADDSLHWWHDQTLPMFRGAAMASALTGYALAGISAVFAPVALPIAATAMIGAMIAGIFFSREAIEDKRREKVLGNLEKALVANVKIAQRQATRQFKGLADRFEYVASDAFDQVLQIRTANLDHQVAQIELARRQTAEEKSALADAVKERLTRLAALIQDIDQALRSARHLIPEAPPHQPMSARDSA